MLPIDVLASHSKHGEIKMRSSKSMSTLARICCRCFDKIVSVVLGFQGRFSGGGVAHYSPIFHPDQRLEFHRQNSGKCCPILSTIISYKSMSYYLGFPPGALHGILSLFGISFTMERLPKTPQRIGRMNFYNSKPGDFLSILLRDVFLRASSQIFLGEYNLQCHFEIGENAVHFPKKIYNMFGAVQGKMLSILPQDFVGKTNLVHVECNLRENRGKCCPFLPRYVQGTWLTNDCGNKLGKFGGNFTENNFTNTILTTNSGNCCRLLPVPFGDIQRRNF